MTLLKTSRTLAATVMLAVLLAAGSGGVAEAKCRYAPSTSVCMELPPGFRASDTFAGFENPTQHTEVHVSELDRPYRDVVADMTMDRLERRGMRVIFARKEVIGTAPAMRVKIRDEAGEEPRFRQILIAGYPQKTVLVSAVYPESMETTFLTNRLESMMRSLTYDPDRVPDLVRNLPFHLAAEEGLVLTRRVNNSLIYTKDGRLPKPLATDPAFVVGQAVAAEPVGDRLNFAIERVHRLPDMEEILVDKAEEIAVDGLEGYEITGQARDRESYARLALYEVILYDGDDGYYLMVGTVGLDGKPDYLEKFRAMARSFKRRPAR